MKNKIIWIVNQHAVLPSSFGGTRHFDLAENLAHENYEFYIITAGFSNFEKKEKIDYGRSFFKKQKISKKLNFIWIKTLSYKSNGIRRLWGSRIFALSIRKLINFIPKPDLIIGSSPQLLSSYQALKIARLLKTPFVFEVRDIWPLSLVDLGLNKLNPLIIYFERLEKKLMKSSDHIIGIMPLLSKYAKGKFGISSHKITWISNSLNDSYLRKFSPLPKSKKFIITYTGTIGLAQDIEAIIQAADKLRQIPNLKVQLIGDGVEKQKCIQLVKNLDLESFVDFPKPVRKDKVLNILRKSDALIMSLKNPSAYSYGCQPNKLFDYLGAGRPIIVASSAGRNPLIAANCAVCVKSNSPDKLADAILQIYRMPRAQRTVMGKRALKYLEENYLSSKMAKKLKSILDHLT